MGSEESYPAAGMLPWLQSQGLHPHCRWIGGTLGHNHSHPLSTPEPDQCQCDGMRGEERRGEERKQTKSK